MLERVDEGDRPNEVWCEVLSNQLTLVERLVHELEVELFEIAKPSVEQL